MKKSYLFLFIICLTCTLTIFSGCNKQSFLLDYVSEVRQDIFEGNNPDYNLKAYYGYKETPYANDGNIGEKNYSLTFLLKDIEESQISYSITIIELDNCTLQLKRQSNGTLFAQIESDNFDLKTFSIRLNYASEFIDITMNSVVPTNCLTIGEVLTSLEKSQSDFINYYKVDLKFNAEIYARVIVKNQKPYWYIAFGNKESLKAFLVDGFSGEVLAIRQVI